jgi:hypothetical protein
VSNVTLGEIKDLLSDTIEKVTNMDVTMNRLASSSERMSQAASSMATTYDKTEKRQQTLEEMNIKLYEKKGISPDIFFMVTGTLCGVIVLLAIWITDTYFKASLTSIEAGKKQLEESLNKVKEEIVSEVKDGH